MTDVEKDVLVDAIFLVVPFLILAIGLLVGSWKKLIRKKMHISWVMKIQIQIAKWANNQKWIDESLKKWADPWNIRLSGIAELIGGLFLFSQSVVMLVKAIQVISRYQ